MEVTVITKVLDYYKEKFYLKDSEICDGICSATTFSKRKVCDRNVDFFVAETLLARVGKDVEEFEFLAGEDDYVLWAERLAIKAAMWDKDMEQVEERIAYYREIMPKGQKLHRQFCLYYQVKIAEWKKEDAATICKLAREALFMTKKVEEKPHKRESLYTPIEMDLLLTLVHYRYEEWQEAYRVEWCLRSIIDYVGSYYAVERLEDIEGRAWMELLQIEEERKDTDKMLIYIDGAIQCFSKGTGIIRLAQVRFMKAKLLARTGDKEEKYKNWKEICMEECKMAYCIYTVTERKEQAEEIERFCMEELEWHITM